MLHAPLFLLLAASPARAEVGSAYYHFSLAQQARLAGHYDEALTELRRAQKLDPRSGEVRAEAARLLREAGRSEEARAEAEEAVKVAPDSLEVRRVMAQILHSAAEQQESPEALRKAVAEYEQVIRLDP